MADAMGYDGGLTVSLPVSSLDQAIAWYAEVLGFELLYRMDEIGWCEMTSPVARVNLGLSQVETVTPGGATSTWGVNDVAAARAHLESQSVKLDGDIMTIDGMVSLQTFYDPDGNTLMLYQDLSDG